MTWSAILGLRRLGSIAIVALVCYLITSALIGPAKQVEVQNDRSARDYIGRAVPSFLTYWDFDAFESRAAGELKASRDFELIRHTFARGKKKLGKPISYGPIVGQVNDSFATDYSGEIISAVYTQKVSFKYEEAAIIMSLVRREGGWKFQKLAVRAPSIIDFNE
ncbi:MAG: hypothetical protein ABL949_13300 [Fimbriimonadaceae bacterium]